MTSGGGPKSSIICHLSTTLKCKLRFTKEKYTTGDFKYLIGLFQTVSTKYKIEHYAFSYLFLHFVNLTLLHLFITSSLLMLSKQAEITKQQQNDNVTHGRTPIKVQTIENIKSQY